MTAAQLCDRVGLAPIDLLRAEEHAQAPACGWAVLESALLAALEERVREALAAGVRWQDMRLPGFSAVEIRAAAETVRG